MQDIECGHVYERIDGLLEEAPGLIFGDAFIDSLKGVI